MSRSTLNTQILQLVNTYRNVKRSAEAGILTDGQCSYVLTGLWRELCALFAESHKQFSNDFQIRLAAERLDVAAIEHYASQPYPAR